MNRQSIPGVLRNFACIVTRARGATCAAAVIAGLLLVGTAHAQNIPGDRMPSVPMVIAGSDSAALLAQDTRFDPRLQLRSSLRVGLGATIGMRLEVGAGMGLVRAVPTSADPGYSYPGWLGRSLWVRAAYLFAPRSRIGLHATVSGVFAGFDSTYLLTFFPVIEAGPSLQIRMTANDSVLLALSFGWEIRKDRGISLGDTSEGSVVITGSPMIGIVTEFRLTPPGPNAEEPEDRNGKR